MLGPQYTQIKNTHDFASPLALAFFRTVALISFTAECYPNFCCLLVTILPKLSIEEDVGVIAFQEVLGRFQCRKPEKTKASRYF